MFDIVIINSILIVFPILLYLIYIVYQNVIGKKGNKIFLFLAIASSIYLITKYSKIFNYETDVIKILFLFCLIKSDWKLSLLCGFYLTLYYSNVFNVNIIIILTIYIIQTLLFIKIFKNKNIKFKVSIFLLIEIISSLFLSKYKIDYIIISNIIYSALGYVFALSIINAEKAIDIHGTIKQIEYEKNFRDSLFKVTHEIKNPIAVCKGYLDMIDPLNQNQVNKYIPIIRQEIDRTLVIMNDFLNLTKLKIDKTTIHITILLDDIYSSIGTLLKIKNININYNILDEEIFIEGDYNRLKQVIVNIIKNSIESFDKKDGNIKLNLKKNKKNVIIEIIDDGIGMDKDTLKNIGNMFFTTKNNGTGLGVKLCLEIINLHGGEIEYKSKKNNGTKVKISLPLYNKKKY